MKRPAIDIWRRVAGNLLGRLRNGFRCGSGFSSDNTVIEVARRSWTGPLVSVIVTCYNYGRYLDRLLASLAKQSWKSFEIILIDDGSTDLFTREYLQNLEKKRRPFLKIITQENRGVVAARNRAIAAAAGKYIFPLDADDAIEKTFLEKMVFFLENSPDFYFVYSWTHSTGKEDFIWETYNTDPLAILDENRVGVAVFSKLAFDAVGGYNPVMSDGFEDWELYVNFVAHGYCGRVIREPLYDYFVKTGARNDRALRLQEDLRNRIGMLHRDTIKKQARKLQVRCRRPGRVTNGLVNLLRDRVDLHSVSMLDLGSCQRDITEKLLHEINLRVATRDGVLLLLLDRPRPEIFIDDLCDNLFVYWPAGYHPEGRPEPFVEYLTERYCPQILTLDELLGNS